MDGSTMSTSHKTVRTAPFFARIYEFAMDRLSTNVPSPYLIRFA